MKTKTRTSRLSLQCEHGWLNLKCRFRLHDLGRAVALVALAAATAWGGPELVRFVQLLLRQG
jgi:hypothetical protein